ncbi:MAG: acyltransferase family protein, partial [Prevotella sp.]
MSVSPTKVRLTWLDALRGFTMILVVANHINLMSFGENWKQSAALSFLMLFRMPLFFFVSGFLSYKACQVWNRREFSTLLLKKLRVQLVPTAFFFTLYCLLMYKDFLVIVNSYLMKDFKGGYWFTLVLLEMFVVYYLFAWIESKVRKSSYIPIVILFLLSIVFYSTCYMPKMFPWAEGHRPPDGVWWMNMLSLSRLMMYMPFFVAGNIVRRYWNLAERLMDSRWFFPLLLFLSLCGSVEYIKLHTLHIDYRFIPLTITKFALIGVVVMVFRHYQEYFSHSTRVGEWLQSIGRRTLDIYLLHYFFIPHLPEIGIYLNHHQPNFVVDITLSCAIAFVVIGFCMIVSRVIRVSPLLAK